MIVATYDFEKEKPSDICDFCSRDGYGCEMRGRHIDAVICCFMFDEKEEGAK